MRLPKHCPISHCVQTIASLVDDQGWKGEPNGGERPLSFSWETVFPRFKPFNEFIVCSLRFGTSHLGFRGTGRCQAELNRNRGMVSVGMQKESRKGCTNFLTRKTLIESSNFLKRLKIENNGLLNASISYQPQRTILCFVYHCSSG